MCCSNSVHEMEKSIPFVTLRATGNYEYTKTVIYCVLGGSVTDFTWFIDYNVKEKKKHCAIT